MYGWTYAQFHARVGWDKGLEPEYLAFENQFSSEIDSYIFTDSGVSPRLTDANEKVEVGTIVNTMMVLMNMYLKGETGGSPLETGFYMNPGYPVFYGDPDANNGKGTGHYLILNKLRRRYSQTEIRVDSIRMGKIPDDNPFPVG